MKHKIIFAACITVIVFVLIFGIGITTALNDEPTSETICDLKIHNKNVKITVVTPQLMMNDVVTKVEINQEQSYTFIGFDSIESIDVNADSLRLVLSSSLHNTKVDTLVVSLNNNKHTSDATAQ